MSLNHYFNIKLATDHSVDVAVFLNNIAHWVRENQANERNFHDDRTWTYNSESAFTQIFPYWTRRQMQRIIKTCIAQNLLLSGNYNKAKYDRTKWYTLSNEMLIVFGLDNRPPQPLVVLIEPNGSMDRTKRVNGMNQTGQPIPNNKTQIKNTNNTYKEKKEIIPNHEIVFDEPKKEIAKIIPKGTKALILVLDNNPHELPHQLVEDFLEVRKAKRAPMTKTALKQLNNELSKCVSLGIEPEFALEMAVSNGWLTVKADWINERNKRSNGSKPDVNSHGWIDEMKDDILI